MAHSVPWNDQLRSTSSSSAGEAQLKRVISISGKGIAPEKIEKEYSYGASKLGAAPITKNSLPGGVRAVCSLSVSRGG